MATDRRSTLFLRPLEIRDCTVRLVWLLPPGCMFLNPPRHAHSSVQDLLVVRGGIHTCRDVGVFSIIWR